MIPVCNVGTQPVEWSALGFVDNDQFGEALPSIHQLTGAGKQCEDAAGDGRRHEVGRSVAALGPIKRGGCG